MPSFNLYTGNRLELLLDGLAGVVEGPHCSPLAQEIVVVQSKGMERWVSMGLARRMGVWANCAFPFPNAFLEGLFGQAFGDKPERSGFEPGLLAWTIMGLVPGMLALEEFAALRGYLRGGGESKLHQLSLRIAEAFDHYTVFRPEMLLDWEQGGESHWQARLWREVVAKVRQPHRARLHRELLVRLRDGTFTWKGRTGRISLFGISSLPPFHIRAIHALSGLIDVHVFLLNPCAEYWDDILSEREIERAVKKHGRKLVAFDDLHWDKGNSLLASLGGAGRDFLAMLHDLDGQEFSLAVEPGGNSLLSRVQSDMLHLRRRGADEVAPPLPMRPSDYSIQVHSCHSPMREVEALHDNLLLLFEKIPGLQASDIAVMAPDIETYAPVVHAVFGAAADERMRIPFGVADRSVGAESGVVSAFFALLALCRSRFTATETLALLEIAPLRDAFGIAEADLERLRQWAADTGVRWGFDRENRAGFVEPAFKQNTWAAGVESMLLSYAMPPDKEGLFEGIAPYEAIEGGEAGLLGDFLDFMEALGDCLRSFSQKHSLAQWAVVLEVCAKRFFIENEESAFERSLLLEAIRKLGEAQSATGFAEDLEIATVQRQLELTLKGGSPASGFMAGGVTFCEMLPMRGIPFRVVCLIGMDNAAFPRRPRNTAWDLIAASPRRGDRRIEKEDRYIFLEALLSARDVFYISYIGQDIYDNGRREPSVVVAELLDAIDRGFVPHEKAGSAMRASSLICRDHRLQAFSPLYFTPGDRLASYSQENFLAARQLHNKLKAMRPFFSAPLSPASESWREITVKDLCAFFGHPVKFLLRKRLGIDLESRMQELKDTEPFFIDGLEGYHAGQEIVERLMGGEGKEALRERLSAQGRLPHGMMGSCEFERLAEEAREFAETVDELCGKAAGGPVALQGELGGFRISGSITGVSAGGPVLYRFSNAKPKDRLGAWITGLAWSALREKDGAGKSVLCCRDAVVEYAHPEKAAEQLEGLLMLYWQGLSRPLHFFPRSSWTYAQGVMVKGKPEDAALDDARKAWAGNEYSRAEADDPYYTLCFGEEDVLDEEFRRLAMEIAGPAVLAEKVVSPDYS